MRKGMFCAPIIASTTKEVLYKIKKSIESVDLFEIRLDLMKEFDLKSIIDQSPKDLLITYRTRFEGGYGDNPPEEFFNYLIEAKLYGAAYIDMELRTPKYYRDKLLMKTKGNSKVIISTHIIDYTPQKSTLEEIFWKQIESGADILKIVTYATDFEDNIRVLSLIPAAKRLGKDIIAFCMGKKGQLSRIFAHLLGSYISFTSLDEIERSAPGQLSISKMNKILELIK